MQKETLRDLEAGAVFLDIARGAKSAPKDPGEHFLATDILNRDIRSYSASLFKQDMPYDQLDLVGSLIEEADFTASLAETLHQVASRVKREKFGQQGQEIIDASLAKLEHSMRAILPNGGFEAPMMPAGHVQNSEVEELRMRTLTQARASPRRNAAPSLRSSAASSGPSCWSGASMQSANPSTAPACWPRSTRRRPSSARTGPVRPAPASRAWYLPNEAGFILPRARREE